MNIQPSDPFTKNQGENFSFVQLNSLQDHQIDQQQLQSSIGLLKDQEQQRMKKQNLFNSNSSLENQIQDYNKSQNSETDIQMVLFQQSDNVNSLQLKDQQNFQQLQQLLIYQGMANQNQIKDQIQYSNSQSNIMNSSSSNNKNQNPIFKQNSDQSNNLQNNVIYSFQNSLRLQSKQDSENIYQEIQIDTIKENQQNTDQKNKFKKNKNQEVQSEQIFKPLVMNTLREYNNERNNQINKKNINDCEKYKEQFFTPYNNQQLHDNENQQIHQQQQQYHKRSKSNSDFSQNKFSSARRNSIQDSISFQKRILNQIQQDYSALTDYVKNINQQIRLDQPLQNINNNNSIFNHNIDELNHYNHDKKQSPQVDNDIITKNFPNQQLFNMIIETPDGKHEQINVHDGANLYDLSYQFCLQNNMDVDKYCQFITNRLQSARDHYNSFQTPKKDSLTKKQYIPQQQELSQPIGQNSSHSQSNCQQNLNNISYSFDQDSHMNIYQEEQKNYQNQKDIKLDQIVQNQIKQNSSHQNSYQKQLFNQTRNLKEQSFQQPKSQTYELNLSSINDEILKDDNSQQQSHLIFNTCFKFDQQQNQLMNDQIIQNDPKITINSVNSPSENISQKFNEFQEINFDRKVQSSCEKMQQLKQNIQKSLEQQHNIQQGFHKRQNSKTLQHEQHKQYNNLEKSSPEKFLNYPNEQYSPYSYRQQMKESSQNYLNASPIPHQLNSYDILKSQEQLDSSNQDKQVIQNKHLNQENQINLDNQFILSKQINHNDPSICYSLDTKSYEKVNNQNSHSDKISMQINTPIKDTCYDKCDFSTSRVEIDEINKYIIMQSRFPGQISGFYSPTAEDSTDKIEQYQIQDQYHIKYPEDSKNQNPIIQKNQISIQNQQINEYIKDSQNPLKKTSCSLASQIDEFNHTNLNSQKNENKNTGYFELYDQVNNCEKINTLKLQNNPSTHHKQVETSHNMKQQQDSIKISNITNNQNSNQKSLNNSEFILIHDEKQFNNLQGQDQKKKFTNQQNRDQKKIDYSNYTQINEQQNAQYIQNYNQPFFYNKQYVKNETIEKNKNDCFDFEQNTIFTKRDNNKNTIYDSQMNDIQDQQKKIEDQSVYNLQGYEQQVNQKNVFNESVQKDEKQQIESYRSISCSSKKNLSALTPSKNKGTQNEIGGISSRSTNRNSAYHSSVYQNISPYSQNQYSTNRNPLSAQSSQRSLNQSSRKQQSLIKENDQNIPYSIQSARGQLNFSSQKKGYENVILTHRDSNSKLQNYQNSSQQSSRPHFNNQQENIDKIKQTIFNSIKQSNPQIINNDVKYVNLNLSPFLEQNTIQSQYQQKEINNKNTNQYNQQYQKQKEYPTSYQSSPSKLRNNSSSILRSSQNNYQKSQNLLLKNSIKDNNLQKDSSNYMRGHSACKVNNFYKYLIKNDKQQQNVETIIHNQNNITNMNQSSQNHKNTSINQAFQQRIYEIFSYLDNDCDGYISSDKIEIRQINDLILFIITPILIEVYNIKRNVNIEEFSCAFLKLFFSLPQQQQEIITDNNLCIVQADTQQNQLFQHLEYFNFISPLYQTYIERKNTINSTQNKNYNYSHEEINKQILDFYINNFKSLGQETQNYLF